METDVKLLTRGITELGGSVVGDSCHRNDQNIIDRNISCAVWCLPTVNLDGQKTKVSQQLFILNILKAVIELQIPLIHCEWVWQSILSVCLISLSYSSSNSTLSVASYHSTISHSVHQNSSSRVNLNLHVNHRLSLDGSEMELKVPSMMNFGNIILIHDGH